VIGAGPAGTTTARLLAERGHDVVILEEHPAVGTPVHCTGLLGVEAFEEFKLPRSIILGQAGSATFWGAAGQSVGIRSDKVQAAVIDRVQLDVWLGEQAVAAGAELRAGWRAETVQVGPDRVIVTGRSGEGVVEARVCVLACGASYRFHRELGLGMPDVFLQSAQLETPFPDMPEVEVRFGRDVAPSGFAWLVPFKRGTQPHVRVGLMSESRAGERFSSFFSALCTRVGADVDPALTPRLKMLPLGPVPKTYSDRVIAVGDAAGLVKPTTGGGIYYGLLSGLLAAEILDESLQRDRLTDSALKRYESRWRRRFGQEIRIGLAFRRIAARLSDESIDALIELARVNGVVPLLQERASFNWHRKAAIALLGHPSFRKIAFKSWARSGELL